jgi:hypothetical protein
MAICYFLYIWYIFSGFGKMCEEKLATLTMTSPQFHALVKKTSNVCRVSKHVPKAALDSSQVAISEQVALNYFRSVYLPTYKYNQIPTK